MVSSGVRVALFAMAAALCARAASPAETASWPFWGEDTHNTRNAAAETAISPTTAQYLTLKWSFIASGDIRATPTVEGNALYLTARGAGSAPAMIYRLNAQTGKIVWSRSIPSYTGDPKSFSGTSPAIAPDFIVIGVLDNIHGAAIYALSKTDGDIVWQTTLAPPPALIKSSPAISGNHIYVGVSSKEEALARQPGYKMKFRGSVQALDFTGKILWRFDTAPAGYTGAPVWGSTLVADTKRHSVYASTGNNYTVPPPVQTCLKAAVTPQQQRACLDPNDYEDSVLALDANTGALKWGESFIGFDTSNDSCNSPPPPPNSTPCPDPRGPDYDFGSGPNLFTVAIGGTPTDLLGIGQKSGVYRALNPDTGALVWSQQVGPGGSDGGIEWGSATDGQRLYVAIDNSTNAPFDIGPPANVTNWTGGAWAALDAATGSFLWQIPVAGQNLVYPQYPAGGSGAMTIANGVVFAPSMSGAMVALEAASGATLWSYASGVSVNVGPSIVNGMVYWGCGDNNSMDGGTAGNTLFAFGL